MGSVRAWVTTAWTVLQALFSEYIYCSKHVSFVLFLYLYPIKVQICCYWPAVNNSSCGFVDGG